MVLSQPSTDFDPASAECKALEAYLTAKYDSYTREGVYDGVLWAVFKQDFQNWGLDKFNKVPFLCLQRMAIRLRTNGVCVSTDEPLKIAENLYSICQEKAPIPWSEKEAIYHLRTGEILGSHDYHIALKATPEAAQETAQAPARIEYLMNLSELYNHEMKYEGSNDSFGFKLDIFYDCCRQACLPFSPEAHRLALPIILKGEALDFYCTWCESWREQGIDPVEAIRQNFEGKEHRCYVEHKWARTTLQQTINENPGKDTLQCLETMIQELKKLTYSLDPALRTEACLRMKIFTATRTHPACQIATGRPASSVSELINDLRTSISQYQDTHRTMQNRASHVDKETYYTDRHYHGRQLRSPYRGHRLH
uniref:Uncharacterized protein n=1 Tax=Talaromyces marneffei PM1 TaxID=1077442 RepID=A0A093V206_TALMA